MKSMDLMWEKMRNAGYTQTRLAQEMGMARSTLSDKMRRGPAAFTVAELRAAACLLELSLDETVAVFYPWASLGDPAPAPDPAPEPAPAPTPADGLHQLCAAADQQALLAEILTDASRRMATHWQAGLEGLNKAAAVLPAAQRAQCVRPLLAVQGMLAVLCGEGRL